MYIHVKLIDYLGQPQPKVEYIHFREYILMSVQLWNFKDGGS